MHQGCSGSFENGRQVVDKIRYMGFAAQFMPLPFTISCAECGNDFLMEKFESTCPECGMVYGVVPCHAFEVEQVQAAGIGY